MTKKKEKKTLPEFRDKKSWITAWGKKEKDYREEKERQDQLRHTSWKKSRDMQSVGQKNKNPPQNAAMLQLQKVHNTKQIQLHLKRLLWVPSTGARYPEEPF